MKLNKWIISINCTYISCQIKSSFTVIILGEGVILQDPKSDQFSILTACGMKLFISLVLLSLMLRKHFPDASSSKSSWRRCEESLTMFRALFLHRLWKSSWAERGETSMTILCRASLSDILQLEYHVEMQWVSTRPLWKVQRMLVGREICFCSLRKFSLCWDRFKIAEVFLFQLRSCQICTPRILMFSTLSSVCLLVLRGACSGRDLWKAMIVSFVLSTLSSRLFSLHRPSNLLYLVQRVII